MTMWTLRSVFGSLVVTVAVACPVAAPALAFIGGGPPESNTPGSRSTILVTLPSGTICSGTIVGPRIVLTAAHCVAEGEATPVFAKVGDRVQEMSCSIAPRPAQGALSDIALCASGVPFFDQPIARVSVEPQGVALADTVTLFGFGCRLAGGIDRNLGQLTSGSARVVEVAGAEAVLSGAAPCFGDGGGGAYVPAPNGEGWFLVGISTRGDLNDRSWIALTTGPSFVAWARAWSELRGGICGLSDATACEPRVGEPLPPLTEPDPSGRAQAAEERLTFSPPVAGPSVDGVPVRELTRITLRKGETLEDSVLRACGAVPEEYLAALIKLKHEGQTPLIPAVPAGSDVEIDILPCPGTISEKVESVTIRKGDTLSAFYEIARKESSEWRGLKAPVGTPRDEQILYYVDAVRALNSGVEPKALARGRSLQLPKSPSAVLASAEATSTGGEKITAILALQGADGECAGPQDYRTYPFDVEALLELLARNRAKRNSLDLDVKRVVVLTADTGIYAAGRGIFRNEGVLLQKGGTYDDLRPLGEGPEPMHGTEVASLLLGGPLLGRVQTIAPRRISLVSRRIYTNDVLPSGETFYRAEYDVMGRIRSQVNDDNVQVVNLSLKTPSEITALEDQAKDSKARALFVAAAGNQDGQLGDPGTSVYPAMYGGVTSTGLLVVAALDGEGAPARFSNYSNYFVEIGAPGCLVPVVSAVLGEGAEVTGFRSELLSGTSLATPLVAFGAALLESERSGSQDMSPANVKRRLLASADLKTELTPFIADGRAFNLVKAVSVFHDVVELKDSRLLFGEVTFLDDGKELAETHFLELTCDVAPLKLKVADILKVVPAFAKKGKLPTFKVYARSATEVLRNLECDTPAKLGISIRVADTDATEIYRLDEVTDIVRHELH